MKRPAIIRHSGNRTTRAVFLLLGACLILLLLTPRTIAQEQPAPAPTPTLEPTPPPPPRPVPDVVLNQEPLRVEYYFPALAQGTAGLVRVTGGDWRSVQARFLDRVIDLFLVTTPPNAGWYGLLAVNMEQNAGGSYALTLFFTDANGSTTTLDTTVDISVGSFIRQDVTVQPDRAYLIDPEVERREFSRLESIQNVVTPQTLWDAQGLDLPLNSELTSPFGAVRMFNDTVLTRHTGWDFRAPVGQPVLAAGAGQVAFAGQMEIRGNHVIIDHGRGVFTGYSHLSQIHVTRGQTVTRGQIIGVSGDTGRSSGAHLHWEATVNGEWVDPVLLADMWLPVEGG